MSTDRRGADAESASWPIVIGVDAGGTHTRATAATLDGRIVARARSAAGNPRTAGDDAGRAQVAEAVAEVRRAASGQVLHLAIGSAGLVDPAPPEACRRWADHLGVESVTVDSDARIAHAAAFGAGQGIMVVAGTGSQCLAFGPDGRRVRVGGWGPAFGDEGSAYWIARHAIATALRSLDADTDHPFAEALLEAAGAASATPSAARHDALLDYLYGPGAGPTRHAAFARHVARQAEDGVAEASSLLEAAGRELARLALSAAERSGCHRVARAGSVLDENRTVRDAFERRCREDGLDVLPGRWDPVRGAVQLALNAVGRPVA